MAYSYLATGLVMSGFNLLVSRWQKAATQGDTLPIRPQEGIKQIGSASETRQDTNPDPTSQEYELDYKPVEIGSLTYTKGSTGLARDAYIDIEMGDVRLPVDIDNTHGITGGGQSVADGDKLVISYTSGGRTVTREVLDTVSGGAGKFAACASIANAYRTAHYPIDLGSVVLEIFDANLETYYQIESLEIDNINGKIYYDKTDDVAADATADYESYTAIEGAKLEVTKVDTSFITWRRYSDEDGLIYIAQTIEDETYDWTLSAATKVTAIRAAQTAVLATKHELVVMEAAA
jgi:hypothetical protein